ncbi:hypothetical protein BGX24_008391 [Mortierella sp. AD032]|nr:hypothetical protein BGX24_008391 [Mortierella sp. AD032]
MKTESKPPSPRHEIDNRIPVEIWEQIFSNLYPSQLCRLSMVSRAFETIVTLLPIWYQLFTENNFKKRLRFLRGISESKSYMLYMCANSLHICEECGHQENFDSTILADLPLPVLVRLPKRHCPSDEEIEYVGDQLNLTWAVRKCRICRKKQGEGRGNEEFEPVMPRTSPPPMPKSAEEWCKIYPGLSRVVDHEGYGYNWEMKEDGVLGELEFYYGGALGAEASSKPATEYDNKTKARILWYRQQD